MSVRVFEQLRKDVEGRLACYTEDWKDVANAGTFLLAPTVYIFLASVIPAMAFGQQLFDKTDGLLGIPHVLVVTAMAGIIQAFFGGQPLLIIGVAEPIVVLYGFIYKLVKDDDDLGVDKFLPFCSWVCLWTGILCAILAVLGATEGIRYFTLFAGELFGGLIAILFLQQAFYATYEEFHADGLTTSEGSINGLWSVFTVCGLPATIFGFSMLRHSSLLLPTMRKIADYSPAIMCLVWTGFSYIVTADYSDVPQRVDPKQVWDVNTWDMVSNMGDVPTKGIFLAIAPAVAIAILFYFDHTVSSQLAQTGDDVTVERPPAYAWDLLLLGIMAVIAGMLGMPPINGVIPQAPMHARSLRGIIAEQKRKEKKREAKALAQEQGLEGTVTITRKVNEGDVVSEIMTKMKLMQKEAEVIANAMDKEALEKVLDCEIIVESELRPSQFDAVMEEGGWLSKGKLAVMEQRGSNLFQALMVLVCAFCVPAIKRIPTCVLWGYFVFMALESLPGMQLVNRVVLLFTDWRKREEHLEGQPYADVPYWTIVQFTLLQVFSLLAIWMLILFGGIAGLGFPIPILLLLPLRSHVLPQLFGAENMAKLDFAEYEEPISAPSVTAEEEVKQPEKEMEAPTLGDMEVEVQAGPSGTAKRECC
jgi:hypothetical protein